MVPLIQSSCYEHCLRYQQIHWPFRTKPGSRGFDPEVIEPLCLKETWSTMEGLYASGRARAIGVSNFSTKKLQDLLTYAKVTPAVNQVECHPVWQQPNLHRLCKSTNVHLSVLVPLPLSCPWEFLVSGNRENNWVKENNNQRWDFMKEALLYLLFLKLDL